MNQRNAFKVFKRFFSFQSRIFPPIHFISVQKYARFLKLASGNASWTFKNSFCVELETLRKIASLRQDLSCIKESFSSRLKTFF